MTRSRYEERIKSRLKRSEMRRLANQEKLNRGACVDCGLKVHVGNLVAFDFDHVERETKTLGIAAMKASSTPKQLAEELVKCVLRCAICHRLKTYADRDYLSLHDVRLTDTSQPTLFEDAS